MYTYFYILLAWLIIIIDLFLLYKNRENPLLLISNLLIFYFNYSICVGEYIAHSAIISENDLYYSSYGNIYKSGLLIFFLFSLIRFFVFKNKIVFKPIKLGNNPILFYCLWFVLLYIGIFEINREQSLLYEVKITPLFEYSIFIFILLMLYQGDSRTHKVLTHLMVFFFIAQDTFYGGRATSIQLLIVLIIFQYTKFIRFKYLIIFIPFALMFFTIVGVTRGNSSSFTIIEVYKEISRTYFIQDTAVYAYFASMTHVNAWFYVDKGLQFSSFLAFLSSVFFGSQAGIIFGFPQDLALVSRISSNYHWNVGGGLCFTWYYFWFGYYGVILLSSFMFGLFKKTALSNREIYKLIFIGIIITTPRWYLYSPLAFFRGPFVIFPILIISCFLIDKMLKGNKIINLK